MTGIRTLRCDICGATESKLGIPWKSEQALAIHQHRVHPANPRTPSANGTSQPIPKPRKQKAAPLLVQFCPCCGLNLSLLQAALTVGKGMK